jgi:hypothetical protein
MPRNLEAVGHAQQVGDLLCAFAIRHHRVPIMSRSPAASSARNA